MLDRKNHAPPQFREERRQASRLWLKFEDELSQIVIAFFFKTAIVGQLMKLFRTFKTTMLKGMTNFTIVRSYPTNPFAERVWFGRRFVQGFFGHAIHFLNP